MYYHGTAAASCWEGSGEEELAPFVSLPEAMLDELLGRIGLTKESVLLDLGCGDGVVMRAALGHGIRKAVGIELKPALCETARGLCETAGYSPEAALVVQGDVLELLKGGNQPEQDRLDVHAVTHVLAYLSPFAMKKLGPILMSAAFGPSLQTVVAVEYAIEEDNDRPVPVQGGSVDSADDSPWRNRLIAEHSIHGMVFYQYRRR
jgi:hypothetical protein